MPEPRLNKICGEVCGDLFQPFLLQFGHKAFGQQAVDGADGHCQRVHAGALGKADRILGGAVDHIGDNTVLKVCRFADAADLAFHTDAGGMGHLDDLAGQADVFLIGQMGAIEHDRGKTGLYGLHAPLITFGVVVVQCKRVGAALQPGHKVQILLLFGKAEFVGRYLHDQRRGIGFGLFHQRLEHGAFGNIESPHGKTVFPGRLQDLRQIQ